MGIFSIKLFADNNLVKTHSSIASGPLGGVGIDKYSNCTNGIFIYFIGSSDLMQPLITITEKELSVSELNYLIKDTSMNPNQFIVSDSLLKGMSLKIKSLFLSTEKMQSEANYQVLLIIDNYKIVQEIDDSELKKMMGIIKKCSANKNENLNKFASSMEKAFKTDGHER